MENLTSILSFWWVLPILLSVVMYKWVFRLFGVVIVPEDKIGLVTKKFVLVGQNKELSGDRIIATNFNYEDWFENLMNQN